VTVSHSHSTRLPNPEIGIVFSNRISPLLPAKLALFFRIALQPTPTRDQSARFASNRRQYFVMRLAARFVFALSCAAICAAGAAPDLDPTLHAIENRYNHAQSLKLNFSESYLASRRPTQSESGVLYLRKPGRMRWEYTTPAGKIFLADGKDTWLYTPEDHRAEKASLKLSEDDRAPLAFLLGKLDFHKDFQSFESRNESGNTWIVARPKSQNLPYNEVDFLATADGQIHKIRVTNQDQSKLEYTFSNEELNAPVAPGLFVFHPPSGVEVFEAPK
jgi:outer membrane lipoprotein carrier protein